jgi:hypothetical protein
MCGDNSRAQREKSEKFGSRPQSNHKANDSWQALRARRVWRAARSVDGDAGVLSGRPDLWQSKLRAGAPVFQNVTQCDRMHRFVPHVAFDKTKPNPVRGIGFSA